MVSAPFTGCLVFSARHPIVTLVTEQNWTISNNNELCKKHRYIYLCLRKWVLWTSTPKRTFYQDLPSLKGVTWYCDVFYILLKRQNETKPAKWTVTGAKRWQYLFATREIFRHKDPTHLWSLLFTTSQPVHEYLNLAERFW